MAGKDGVAAAVTADAGLPTRDLILADLMADVLDELRLMNSILSEAFGSDIPVNDMKEEL